MKKSIWPAPALLAGLLPVFARTAPEAAPGGPANVFYGALAPGADPNGPVLLFVHGLGTNATYWFTGANDMYQDAYTAGSERSS